MRRLRKDISTNPMLQYVKQELSNCSDVIFHAIEGKDNYHCMVVYIDTIIDKKRLHENLIPIFMRELENAPQHVYQQLEHNQLLPMPVSKAQNKEQVVSELLIGKVAIFFSHCDDVFLLSSLTRYEKRGVPESKNEMVIVGPQEAFSEDIDTNLSLLRHRIRHQHFKVKDYVIGKLTRTKLCIIYIEGICDPKLIQKIEKQIQKIDAFKMMGVSFISDHLEEYMKSPFPQFQYTERPDTLAAALTEGRVGIMVEGTPMTLIAPVTFFTLMQSPEDYYQRFFAATWIRWIRYFFVTISFLLPSVYVAVTTFHPEMLPSSLLITVAAARENIPFPTIFEALMMEVTFEGLREAGIRIPKPIGQTVSIIGAIVIGQAAVQAGIVSAPVVIVVSITGIASFVIPHFELGLSFRLLRFPLMIAGGTLGLVGLIIAVFLIFLHLVSIESFGVPYMRPIAPFVSKDWRDLFVRAPWTVLKRRTKAFQSKEDRS
ncbi:spore germination protein KA [Seinonella peptonophila]|uniref:Spore germination protein KA n=1 Tax=Seinonella peptonophila TaxID=112248 RepID=A0A1M4Y4W0_9BACL|nr:spore germination protein [Seinonella peptonophila]SHF00603.1 spore germination protein KA [Seinonella peptonophila]